MTELEGPHFSTAGWDQDHSGVHPVEMLARIAKFEGKEEARYAGVNILHHGMIMKQK